MKNLVPLTHQEMIETEGGFLWVALLFGAAIGLWIAVVGN